MLADQRLIDGLRPASVDDRRLQAVLRRQAIGDHQEALHDRSKSHQQQILASTQDLAAPDLERLPLAVRQVLARVARVVDAHRSWIRQRGDHHVAQLLLILGRANRQVRKAALSGEREHALVAGAVLTDEPRPVDGEEHRQVVLAHVMDELVEGALAEGRVQGHHRPPPGERQPRSHGQAVLLGDADVEEAAREALGESRQASPGGHASGDGADALVLRGEANELLHEGLRVGLGLA